MEENEKSQAPAATATSPQVSVPFGALLETDTLPILRSELELARNEYRLRHFDEVRANLTKLISRLESSLAPGDEGPEASQRHLIKGSALTLMGQTERASESPAAVECFTKAINEFRKVNIAESESPEVHCDFGIALFYAGLVNEAIAKFAKGAEKGSLDAEAYLLYGVGLSQQQDNADKLKLAEKQFRESIKLNPNNPHAYQLLGTNLEAQSEFEDAADNYRRAAALMISSGLMAEAEDTVNHALEINPRDGELLASKGIILVVRGQLDEALRLFDASLKVNPGQALVLGLKGQTLVALGNEDEGLDCLQRAVMLDASQPWLFSALGLVLRNFGRYQESLSALEKAVSLDPHNAAVLGAKGVVHVLLQQPEQARKDLQHAVQLDPKLDWAQTALANLLIQLGRVSEAVVALESALAVSPDHLELTVAKSNALRKLKRHAEVVQLWQHLAQTKKDSPIAWAELGRAYYESKSYESALETSESVLQMDRDFVPALIIKGRALRALDRYSEAVEVLERAVELDVSNVVARAELGASLRRLGKLEESLNQLEEALRLEPNSTLALGHKGETLRQMGRSEEALPILDKALGLDPDDPWLMVTKAAVLRVSNRAEDAIQLLEHAVTIDPNLPRGWAEMGAAFYTKDENEKALEACDRALALKPNYDLALKYKGETLRFLERYDEALVYLDRALAVSPDDAWTLGAQGQTLRSLNRELEAANALERAVAVDPDLAWAWMELGFSYQAQERPEESIKVLKKSLELSFNAEGALFAALMHCDIAEYDEALALLDRAIEKDPKFADLYGLRGWIHENHGVERGELAYREYSKANELRADELIWHGGIANSLFLLKRLSEANEKYADVLKRAARIESPGNDVLSLIGWSNYRLQNYEEAIRSFISLVRENPDDISDQFNLGLALFGNQQASLGRREYERGIELANRKPRPLQRGWFSVAIDDMEIALAIQPQVYETSDFKETEELLRTTLENASKPSAIPFTTRDDQSTTIAVAEPS